jgi:hypothetical protein
MLHSPLEEEEEGIDHQAKTGGMRKFVSPLNGYL